MPRLKADTADRAKGKNTSKKLGEKVMDEMCGTKQSERECALWIIAGNERNGRDVRFPTLPTKQACAIPALLAEQASEIRHIAKIMKKGQIILDELSCLVMMLVSLPCHNIRHPTQQRTSLPLMFPPPFLTVCLTIQ